ncbi:MAG: NAD(P)-binding domain-containing protein [Actinomycetota bacterium]|nr:NAD(P)-binding domain-containing protein [Actinomycetota bacterium]
MRIGIIGSGMVGSSLAVGLARHGHDVMLGTRDTSNPAMMEFVASSEGQGYAGSYAEAARFGDIVITAYPGSLVLETLETIGAGNLADKVVIDVVNPIAHVDGVTSAAYGAEDSAAEVLQRAVPSARVVKAYNTIFARRMVDPDPGDGPTTMRIAGDDAGAKAEVAALLESTGWSVRDLGGLEHARELEAEVVEWAADRDAE